MITKHVEWLMLLLSTLHMAVKNYFLSLLCFCFLLASWFIGIVPHPIMRLLVPVIKDKADQINNTDKYRPIALASILSTVQEQTLLNRLEMFMLTHDNQFGFKRKHDTYISTEDFHVLH